MLLYLMPSPSLTFDIFFINSAVKLSCGIQIWGHLFVGCRIVISDLTLGAFVKSLAGRVNLFDVLSVRMLQSLISVAVI